MERAEHDITADLIRELLREQHPDLAGLPLTLGARGWDNQLWRLGDDLAVRIPWATGRAGELLRKEHAWVPTFAPRLTLPVPVPQRLGEPSARFPQPWIVTTWVAGEPADQAPVTRGAEAADALAGFLAALHRPAPDEAPDGERGQPLGRGGHFAGMLAEAVGFGLIPDPDAVRAIWEDAVAASAWDGPRLWLHGDLHPANVLTRDGTLCGVVDFGDLCAGDPAVDFAAPWILLPDGCIDRFHEAYRDRAAYGPALDEATLRRARGRAVGRAVGCLLIGHAGDHGRPGGKSTWGPPGRASLDRLIASAG
ncbi:MAG TPA: aminoglycoside phosphotransferase family protein [Trebonia sp.]